MGRAVLRAAGWESRGNWRHAKSRTRDAGDDAHGASCIRQVAGRTRDAGDDEEDPVREKRPMRIFRRFRVSFPPVSAANQPSTGTSVRRQGTGTYFESAGRSTITVFSPVSGHAMQMRALCPSSDRATRLRSARGRCESAPTGR